MGAKSLRGSAASRPSRSLHYAADGLLAAALALAAASPAAATQPRPGEPGGKFSSGELNAVAAVSSTDAWMVGDNPNANDSFQTLVLHWDASTGSRCRPQAPAAPVRGCIGSFLVDVSAVSSSDAWAVGSFATVNPQKGFSVPSARSRPRQHAGGPGLSDVAATCGAFPRRR